ncbi:hypothetical protein OPV22_022716 [Ensete ventricosum]|uniref:Uncharacterized protein n=1 Tax=Ensete ventricosum TaxID=4639 RepID=A0AAV8QV17_ENSVE|nr:hypothetical protein OPV22_022716 [Ensete ventricosum]
MTEGRSVCPRASEATWCVGDTNTAAWPTNTRSPTGPAAQSDKPRFLPPLDTIPVSRSVFPFLTGSRRTAVAHEDNRRLRPPAVTSPLHRRKAEERSGEEDASFIVFVI